MSATAYVTTSSGVTNKGTISRDDGVYRLESSQGVIEFIKEDIQDMGRTDNGIKHIILKGPHG